MLGKLYDNSQKNTGNRSQDWEEETNKLEMEKLSVECDLKNAVTEHHSIMHDIRPLLRSFAHASFYLTAFTFVSNTNSLSIMSEEL